MNKLRFISAFSLLFLISKLVYAEQVILEPESWSYPDIIERARKIRSKNIEGKLFNQHGLAYSFSELAKLKLSSLPAIELQKYADIVTHAYPDAAAKFFPDQCDTLPVEQLNEISVPSAAYISINAASPDIRTWASECLAAMQSYLAELGR